MSTYLPMYLFQTIHLPQPSYVYQAISILSRRRWGWYVPNCQTTLVIALDALFLLFCIFINTTAYHLDRYEPSPPSTKELHGLIISGNIT